MAVDDRINRLRVETYAIYLAAKDFRVRWYVKALLMLLIGYELSPFDVFPLRLDDLVVVPLIVFLATKLIPADVLREQREKAVELIEQGKSIKSWIAGAVVLVLSLLFGAWVLWEGWEFFAPILSRIKSGASALPAPEKSLAFFFPFPWGTLVDR